MAIMGRKEAKRQWAMIERAAEGTWPNVPGAWPAQRFKREDWDSVFGEYDVVTDAGVTLADQLVEAYPKARVGIVQRDYDKWWASFQVQVLDTLMHPFAQPILSFSSHDNPRREGSEGHAENSDWIFRCEGWQGYPGEFEEDILCIVRQNPEKFSPGRRLDQRLVEGWEPLCAFLGKDVPDVPFPNVNDKVEHEARKLMEFKELLRQFFAVLKSRL